MVRPVPSAAVLAAVAGYLDVTVEDLVSPSRRKRVVRARHVAAWLLYEQGLSQSEVGVVLGGRDHTTIHHSLGVVRSVPMLMDAVDEVREGF